MDNCPFKTNQIAIRNHSKVDGHRRKLFLLSPQKITINPSQNLLPLSVQSYLTLNMQHDKMKEVIRHFGAEVIDLPKLKNHSNSVFTRDSALCTPEGNIKLRPGLTSRFGEENWIAE